VTIHMNRSGVYRYVIYLLLFVSLNNCGSIAFAVDKTKGLKSFNTLKSHTESKNGYVDEIDFIQSEIDKIKDDLKWLSSKVEKMEGNKLFVPEKMYNSLDFKKTKIQLLTRLQKKFETLSGMNRAIGDLNKVMIPPKDQSCSVAFLEKRIKQSGLSDWLELVEDQNTPRFENRLPILFVSGSARVANEYKTFMKNLSSVLKGCTVRVFVDGYADIDPISTNRYPSNFELGAARAASVIHTLVEDGINPSIFKISTTGQYRFQKHKASEWKSLERHVNITIVPED